MSRRLVTVLALWRNYRFNRASEEHLMRIGKSTLGRCALSLLPFAALLGAGDSKLAEAVKNKDKNSITALLRQHVNVNEAQGDGATALHWAAYWDDLEVADQLLKRSSNVN